MDFLLFLYVYHSLTYSDNNFRLIFCNVGQGDGIFIRSSKGFDIVIDGGPLENSMTKCLERHMPFWDRTIDAVFMTHPDADHLTGLIGVVKSYNVKYFGTSKAPKGTEVYKELMTLLDKKKIKVTWVFAGDKVVTSDGLQMEVRWPTMQFLSNPSDDTNDYSLVHLLEYGSFRSILTGDVPSVYLNSIMPTVKSVDVFKPPHHGSKTGVDEFTFQHASAKLAVISAGKKNRYGHPSKEVIQVLEAKNIPYKYTFEGDVEIVSDGKEWRIMGWE
ncbi:MAG: MBL fold metallo-hydrolase [Candidatus Levybacteria bacterium]|nr:MBL fold metallo-hydrolase [Candidatus Levybacteria bacterium]